MSNIVQLYKFIFFLIFIIFTADISADNLNTGARAKALGNAKLALVDQWSCVNNRSLICRLEGNGVCANYQNCFGVKEFSCQSICAYMSKTSMGLSINFERFGETTYSEEKLGFSYSKQLGPRVFCGIGINLNRKRAVLDDKMLNVASFDFSMSHYIDKNTLLAFQVVNPTEEYFVVSEDKEPVASFISVGISRIFSNKSLVIIETEKELNSKLLYKFGIEYAIAEHMFLQAGFQTHHSNISMGLRYEYHDFIFNIAFVKHPKLNYSTVGTIVYKI
ncbi:MAG: hypothetical protein N4A49_14170 [Marinifilaceae bacterium]|jgi:hypothetical protein|nr:hypothetical protein [Marinifilaceae bacterium]